MVLEAYPTPALSEHPAPPLTIGRGVLRTQIVRWPDTRQRHMSGPSPRAPKELKPLARARGDGPDGGPCNTTPHLTRCSL
jgi:hypothetical protein